MRPYVKWIVAFVLLFGAVVYFTVNHASAEQPAPVPTATVELALPGQPVRHAIEAVDRHVVEPVREHVIEPVREELHKKAQRIEAALKRAEARVEERANERHLPPPPLAPSLAPVDTDAEIRIQPGTPFERSVCTNCQRSLLSRRKALIFRWFLFK